MTELFHGPVREWQPSQDERGLIERLLASNSELERVYGKAYNSGCFIKEFGGDDEKTGVAAVGTMDTLAIAEFRLGVEINPTELTIGDCIDFGAFPGTGESRVERILDGLRQVEESRTIDRKASQSKLEKAQKAHDYLITLGRLTVRFADVERAPRYPDGSRETDVEHSYHLALSAIELAANYFPDLDIGLVAQFSLVHDLPEIYTRDVWTYNISDENRAIKEQAEKEATKRLLLVLPPHIAQLLERYEHQKEPEARFVRFVDKILPAVINIVAGDANTFKEDYNMTSAVAVLEVRKAQTAKLQAMFPEFQFIHIVRDLISNTSIKHLFPDES